MTTAALTRLNVCRINIANAYAHRMRTLRRCSLQTWQAYLAKRRWKRRRLAEAYELHSTTLQRHAVAQCLELGLRLHESRLHGNLQRCAANFAEQLRFVRPFAMRWLKRARSRAAGCLHSTHSQRDHVQGHMGILRQPPSTSLAVPRHAVSAAHASAREAVVAQRCAHDTVAVCSSAHDLPLAGPDRQPALPAGMQTWSMQRERAREETQAWLPCGRGHLAAPAPCATLGDVRVAAELDQAHLEATRTTGVQRLPLHEVQCGHAPWGARRLSSRSDFEQAAPRWAPHADVAKRRSQVRCSLLCVERRPSLI